MDHKRLIAQNLIAGLRVIKQIYRLDALNNSSFRQQWRLVTLQQQADIDWDPHTKLIEDQFAWSSRRLLNRISKGA